MLALSQDSVPARWRPLHESPGLSPQSNLRYTDLIVAPATPRGPGARAILRLTGDGVWDALRQIVHAKAELPARLQPGCYTTQLQLPDFYSPLPVQVQAWAAPWTYTGQDLVELHLISSPPLVQALLDHLLASGARLAEPGEFTLRAYLAGKLDLTQAEAVHTLSTSSDSDELRTALTQLAGGLGRPLDALREEILLLLAEVEAGLDFADEDLSFIDNHALTWRLDACKMALEAVEEQMHRQGRSHDQCRVVLAGQPNAGKSSLFNALLGQRHSIVSPVPGTTRDYVTQNFTIQGAALELVDTAGEEAAQSVIEDQAQQLRAEQVQRADLVVLCFDARNGLSEADEQLLRRTPADKLLLVATKSDLPGISDLPHQAIQTSTITGAGIATLRFTLAEKARQLRTPTRLSPSLSRCQVHVEQALASITQAMELVQENRHMELVAAELRLALDQIGRMVGAVYTDDLLDRVFSQFCIGK
jgi:tRNA modification GTPase